MTERPDYDFSPPEAALDALLEAQVRLAETGFVDRGPAIEVELAALGDGEGVAADPVPGVVVFRGAVPET